MGPQQKARFEEDYLKKEEFLKNFVNKNYLNLYLRSLITRKRGAYQAMVKDRASKLPKEQHTDYAVYKSMEEYKNLTTEELQTYQEMADTINKEKYLGFTKHVSLLDAMKKERAVKLPSTYQLCDEQGTLRL